MFNNTEIEKKIGVRKFIKLVQSYSLEQIECTDHVFFRLSQKQKKIFTCNELKKVLLNKKPFIAGIQYNNNYAVFYKYKNKNLKIILKIDKQKIHIVTFYFIEEWQIPKI